MKRKRTKKEPDDPAQRMVDFTRRLLNVRKTEVDELRKNRAPAKKPR
jgi:hypothetical protein